MTSSIVLKAKNLRKTFDYPVVTPILNGVELTVKRGETVAIMGRSGEGKSTLLHILGTLDNPSAGTLEISGHDVSRFNKTTIRNRHVGFIFQSYHLLEDCTVLENVLMPAKIARCSTSKGSAAYNKGMDLLEHVGLSERAHYNAKQLSGGEKQRTAIARALCNDPDILLADEPSGNLDSHNAAIIHHLLLDFARKAHKALIVVSHDRELAELCDTRYMMRNGILEQQLMNNMIDKDSK